MNVRPVELSTFASFFTEFYTPFLSSDSDFYLINIAKKFFHQTSPKKAKAQNHNHFVSFVTRGLFYYRAKRVSGGNWEKIVFYENTLNDTSIQDFHIHTI